MLLPVLMMPARLLLLLLLLMLLLLLLLMLRAWRRARSCAHCSPAVRLKI
jgi:hypothetical protein